MSRTIRRKTGDRWFAKKQTVRVHTGRYIPREGFVYKYDHVTHTWEERPVTWLYWEAIEVRQEFDQELISKYTRDRYEGRYSPVVKEYDNYTRRACQREQLSRLMKGQEHYDDSCEEAACKGAKWYFD